MSKTISKQSKWDYIRMPNIMTGKLIVNRAPRHAIAQPEIKVDYLKRLGLPPLASISKTKIRVKGDTEIHYYESDTDSEFSPEEAEDM